MMLSHEISERTKAATVKLVGKGGQGVLVPGGFILSAAHCIDWHTDGGMALGDHCLETITTTTGSTFRTSVVAVEPVADIAVLGMADRQTFYEDAEAFEKYCETRPIPVSAEDLALDVKLSVHVLTHHGTWTLATAERFGLEIGGTVFIDAKQDIEGGTSGGPVIDDLGRLVGVISSAGGIDGASREGQIPRPHLALPGWVWRLIEAGGERT